MADAVHLSLAGENRLPCNGQNPAPKPPPGPLEDLPPEVPPVPTSLLPHSARAFLCFAAIVASGTSNHADDGTMRFFENRIRPLLVDRCYQCHSGKTDEGGLRLDQADSIERGGDSGAAVIPGNPDASLLVSAIRYDGLEMPPDEPLTKAEVADIEQWIRTGATWPVKTTASDDADREDQDDADRNQWWAARPIEVQSPPGPFHGIDSPTAIDRFIDAKLDDNGLHRSPTADREHLIRRLSFDLLGVGPSPETIDRFVRDRRPGAYERLVDAMFADPGYGTRMARLWLDLVRYAESDGWRADAYRPQAYRYRDFVVDAFNEKMPYDRFVQLQLAGDELAPDDQRALAAVGFLRLGIYEYNQRDAEGQWQNIVDEITDVTADVFLATGLACAKCHDHKFDPIPRSDYFRLRSVFEPVLFIDQVAQQSRFSGSAGDEQARVLLAELRQVEGTGIDELSDFAIDRFPLEVQAAYRKPADQRNSYEHQLAYLVARQVVDEGLRSNKIESKLGKERFARREQILKQLDSLGANPYSIAQLITVGDAPGAIRPTRLPGRTQGRTFSPGIPEVFGGQDLTVDRPVDAPQSSGRRSALARWITANDNPITPRVIVNRLWQYHFDEGLVSTPNDFGLLGQKPSHPELLDHLASDLVRSGWDLQHIQRQIVTSAAYRQASVHPDAASALAIDAQNRLVWHHPVRRLDAEQYRDALLVAMDRLIDHFGGPGPKGTEGRRSIYLRRFRNTSDDMLASLDAPPGVVGTARRDVTTTAPQSLMMLNNARIVGVAKSFAARVRRDVQDIAPEARPAAFVDRAHRILAGTGAPDEVVALLVPLVQAGDDGQVDACHVLINSNAFLFIE